MSWFNQKQNAVLGLDISTAAVKLLELSKVGTRYRVESYAVSPLPQDAFVDKNIANTDAIAEAIKAAVKQSGTKLKDACVAVSGSAVMSKVITIPASLGDAEIEDQVLDEAAQYVPYSLDEVNLDFEVQRVNEANPQMLDVLLVASRKDNVNDRVEALSKAGLKTKIVDVEAFAIENSFALLTDQLEGFNEGKTYAVADIGATMAALSIVHDGRTILTPKAGCLPPHTLLTTLEYTMNKAFALIAVATLSALPIIAQSACTRADLTGTWRLYTVFDSPWRCTLVMPSSGKTATAASYCYLPGVVSSTPLKGTLTIDSTCHVAGSFNAAGLNRTVDAWVSKGKDSIAGIGWSPNNVYQGNAFSGVKQ